jgi:integrase
MRSGPTLRSQAEIAVRAISVVHEFGVLPHVVGGERYINRELKVSAVEPHHIQQATAYWYSEGVSPATITKRLNCLSKLGVNVDGCRVKVPKQLKWHLKESDKPKVLAWCREQFEKHRVPWLDILADYIEWTTITGLRIEESLWLDLGNDFSPDYSAVSVPGLKTATSQATLPLGAEASGVAFRRSFASTSLMFPIPYKDLQEAWELVREHFGWQHDPTATLKALRRSAARYLHVDCGMPLHMVQQYLRHESMDTTLEYLRLAGGYGTEEMRRYLR